MMVLMTMMKMVMMMMMISRITNMYYYYYYYYYCYGHAARRTQTAFGPLFSALFDHGAPAGRPFSSAEMLPAVMRFSSVEREGLRESRRANRNTLI